MNATLQHCVLYALDVSGGGLAQALIRGGQMVTMVEPDSDDGARVRDILGKQPGGGLIGVARAVPKRCDVFICRALHAVYAPETALVILVDALQLPEDMPNASRTVAADILGAPVAELIMGSASLGARTAALAFLARLGGPVIVSENCPRFAGAQLQDAAFAMADRVLLAGVTPWELDAALIAEGLKDGLLAAQDTTGLGVAYARRKAAGTALLVADRMVAEGRLGRSVGVGWYRYPGGGGAVIDPLMEDMIVEEARFADIPAGTVSDAHAAELLIAGVINVAARLWAEGMSRRDLDILAIHRVGLPGMCARAQAIGFDALCRRLEAGSAMDETLWQSSSQLQAFVSGVKEYP